MYIFFGGTTDGGHDGRVPSTRSMYKLTCIVFIISSKFLQWIYKYIFPGPDLHLWGLIRYENVEALRRGAEFKSNEFVKR